MADAWKAREPGVHVRGAVVGSSGILPVEVYGDDEQLGDAAGAGDLERRPPGVVLVGVLT